MKTILAVDDYAPHAYALKRTLEREGYRVLAAETGTIALERATEMPDLILLDVGLPDVNGYEVCRRIKANAKTASIPVVFLSATHVSVEAVLEGLSCGASEFLFHPVDVVELLTVIRGSLARAEQMKKPTSPAAPGAN